MAKICGIKVYASLIIGFPGETFEDRQMTLDFVKRIKPDYPGFNVFVGLPGSDIFRQIKEQNLDEYEDDITGLVYLKGHNIRARKFYGVNTNLLSPVESSPEFEYLPI